MPAAWPIDTDITPFLGGATLRPNFDMAGAIADAIEELEGRTGRQFLADALDSISLYDQADYRSKRILLQLPDYLSITELRVDVTSTSTGKVITASTEFLTLPRQKHTGWPIEGIEFRCYGSYGPDSIQIIGKKGSFATIPNRAWNAVAMRAAARGINSAQPAPGGVKQREQGDRMIAYHAPPVGQVSGLSAVYESEFEDAVSYYTRIPIT